MHMNTLWPVAGAALLSLGVAFAQAVVNEPPPDSTPLAGEDIRARVAGKVFNWQAATARFPARLQFDANGYAFINVSNGQNDSGTWRIEGTKLCTQWQRIPSSC